MIVAASLITYWQAIVLGLLQGVSELFPISSLGHSVILPQLLGWDIHQNDAYFITFLVATHLATALVLLGFFWRDWVRIVQGLGRSLRDREIAPTTPTRSSAGCWSSARSRPASSGCCSSTSCAASSPRPPSAAFFLMLNGLLLFGAEAAAPARAAGRTRTTTRGSRTSRAGGIAFFVGAAQALALIPGFSRSGATMGGGLLVGLSQQGRRPFRVPARDPDHRRRRRCSSCRSCSAPRATASAARRSSPRSAPRAPPTSPCAS